MLNAGQDIPLPLWAKLIKFGLINLKDNDLKRKEEAKLKGDKDKGGKNLPFVSMFSQITSFCKLAVNFCVSKEKGCT